MVPLLLLGVLSLVAAHTERNIQNSILTETYNMFPTLTDQGRGRMAVAKKHKMEQWFNMNQCNTDGTCAGVRRMDSEGPAQCVNGFADVYPCKNVDLLSVTSLEDLGYGDPLRLDVFRVSNDIWGWTDVDFNNDEYAIVGISGGTSFVRVTDPTNPEVLAFLYNRRGTTPLIWRDIKIIQNTAYIVADTPGHGIQIVDLTRFRGKTAADFEEIEADNEYREFGNAHNIVSNVETNLIVGVGANCRGGLHMVDVSDRLNPQFLSCFDGDGYVHDAECVIYRGPDTRYQGNEICFCYNEDSFTIVDVTDRINPTILGKRGYIGSAYVHQGWITDDQTIAISNDELDEQNFGVNTRTFVWDITDLTNPTLKTIYESTEAAADHNLYLVGDLVFQSNYEAGLRILHLRKEDYTLHEVGYLDVLPQRTTNAFTGSWSNYPYFESENVILTSMQHGLFIVKPDYEAIQAEVDSLP